MADMYTPEEMTLAFKTLEYPDHRLKRRASQVFDFAAMPEIAKALKITALLHGRARCRFLTGPQVGIPLRIMYLSSVNKFLANPEVVRCSAAMSTREIWDISGPERGWHYYDAPDKAIIQGVNASNEPVTIELNTSCECAEAFMALDYLNGKGPVYSVSPWAHAKALYKKAFSND